MGFITPIVPKLANILLESNKSANLKLCFVRYIRRRTPIGPEPRKFEDRNYQFLHEHDDKKLKLTKPIKGKPLQFELLDQSKKSRIIDKTNDVEMLDLHQERPPYHQYTEEDMKDLQNYGTFFDPLFNPHLHEERNKVDPKQEPFNSIFADSETGRDEYTKVRNITSPELWAHVLNLARITLPPKPKMRKKGEPIQAMPSGFVPPPEVMPDLPYAVPRTRNYLLPVYYFVSDDSEKCQTLIKQVSGDLWQLEHDLRVYLEEIKQSETRIMTSVQEADGRVAFRGRHLKEIVSWLHEKGF